MVSIVNKPNFIKWIVLSFKILLLDISTTIHPVNIAGSNYNEISEVRFQPDIHSLQNTWNGATKIKNKYTENLKSSLTTKQERLRPIVAKLFKIINYIY